MDRTNQKDRMRELAAQIASDHGRAERTAEKADEKANRFRDALEGVFDELKALTRMVKAWARKEYVEVPWKSVATALFALVYFLSPIDLIPDFLAGIGMVDDIAVIRQVVQAIREDLRSFRNWEAGGRVTKEKTAPAETGAV